MKPEEMLVFQIPCKLFLYNLGPANSMDLFETERTVIEDFLSINGINTDIDEGRYFHVGIYDCPISINKDSWTTLITLSKIDVQVKVPIIDGIKMFLPESFIKDFKEGETVHIKLPTLGKLKSNNALYRSNQPVYIIDLQCMVSQSGSVFHEFGKFEDLYQNLK